VKKPGSDVGLFLSIAGLEPAIQKLFENFNLGGIRQRDLGLAAPVLHNAADADAMRLKALKVEVAEGATVFLLDDRGKGALAGSAQRPTCLSRPRCSAS
jgi:hypothetical protein